MQSSVLPIFPVARLYDIDDVYSVYIYPWYHATNTRHAAYVHLFVTSVCREHMYMAGFSAIFVAVLLRVPLQSPRFMFELVTSSTVNYSPMNSSYHSLIHRNSAFGLHQC